GLPVSYPYTKPLVQYRNFKKNTNLIKLFVKAKMIEEFLCETQFDLEEVYENLSEELNLADEQEELHDEVLKFDCQSFDNMQE
ncbi:16474_t:CDS:1, partial [Cetraspora pellucida]